APPRGESVPVLVDALAVLLPARPVAAPPARAGAGSASARRPILDPRADCGGVTPSAAPSAASRRPAASIDPAEEDRVAVGRDHGEVAVAARRLLEPAAAPRDVLAHQDHLDAGLASQPGQGLRTRQLGGELHALGEPRGPVAAVSIEQRSPRV